MTTHDAQTLVLALLLVTHFVGLVIVCWLDPSNLSGKHTRTAPAAPDGSLPNA